MMRAFGTSLLIIGLCVLLVIGLLRVIRDLLSRSVFTGPQSSEDARFSSPDTADAIERRSARG
jgi:hypothetical protein